MIPCVSIFGKFTDPLFSFCYIDLAKASLLLKQIAAPEEWYNNNRFLQEYICRYFALVYSNNKKDKYIYKTSLRGDKNIKINPNLKEACVFNTNLLTMDGEDIYAYFIKYADKKNYMFEGFYTSNDKKMRIFKTLPPPYVVLDKSFVYDKDTEIRINLKHIVTDNFDRFPDEVKKFGEAVVMKLFTSAYTGALKLLERDPLLAVPQIFKEKVCFLIPISLNGDINNPELALTLEPISKNYYIAATCLEPAMFYSYARIIARPQSLWLNNAVLKQANTSKDNVELLERD